MARAKQTARAEARRRHRQAMAEAQEAQDASEAPATPTPSGRARAAASSPTDAPTRPTAAAAIRSGFFGSFRAAYRPVHLREDLAALPTLFRSTAFVVGLAIILVGAGALLLAPGTAVGVLLFQFTVADANGFPAITPMLVAGYLSPRAGWLLGLILGLVQAIVFAGVFRAPSYLLVIGPLAASIGLLCGAGGAWYRRSLAMMSANRPRPNQSARSSRSGTRPRR